MAVIDAGVSDSAVNESAPHAPKITASPVLLPSRQSSAVIVDGVSSRSVRSVGSSLSLAMPAGMLASGIVPVGPWLRANGLMSASISVVLRKASSTAENPAPPVLSVKVSVLVPAVHWTSSSTPSPLADGV